MDGFISGVFGYEIPVVVKKEWANYPSGDAGYNGNLFVVDMSNVESAPLRDRDTKLLTNRQNPGDDRYAAEYLTEMTWEVAQRRRTGFSPASPSHSVGGRVASARPRPQPKEAHAIHLPVPQPRRADPPDAPAGARGRRRPQVIQEPIYVEFTPAEQGGFIYENEKDAADEPLHLPRSHPARGRGDPV